MSGKERTDTNEGETIFDLSSEHSQRKVPELNVDLSQKIMQLRAKTPKNQQQAAFPVAKDIVSPQGGSPRTNKTIEFHQAHEARVPELTIYIEDILRSEDYIKLKKQLEGN